MCKNMQAASLKTDLRFAALKFAGGIELFL